MQIMRTILILLSGVLPVVADVTLVEGGAAIPVRITAATGQAGAFAASEYATYIEKLSGVRPAIVEAAPEGPVVLIEPLGAQPAGAYRFVTRGDTLVVQGSGAEGVIFAIYALLEDHLGVHWFRPGPEGEVLPERREVLSVSIDDEVQVPTFARRWFAYSDAEPVSQELREQTWDWCLKNRLNGPFSDRHPDKLHEARQAFLAKRGYPGSSIFQPPLLFHPNKEGKDHPEYFPVIDGERQVRTKVQYCLSNPGVLERQVADLTASLAQHPTYDFYELKFSWWPRWCECEPCLAATGQREIYYGLERSDYWLDFVSQVATGTRDESPDTQIFVPVRVNTLPAPVRTTSLDPRIHIAISDPISAASQPLDPASKWGRQLKDNLEQWGKVTSHILLDEWMVTQGSLLAPLEDIMAARFRFYAAYDFVEGVRLRAATNWGTEAPANWLAARLLWNPQADLKTLKQEYHAAWYGPAAAPVQEVRRQVAQAIAATPADVTQVNLAAYLYRAYQKLDRPRLEADLQRARQLAKGTAYQERLETFSLAIDFMLLGVTLAGEGQYRLDFQEDVLKLTPNGAAETLRTTEDTLYDRRIASRARTGLSWLLPDAKDEVQPREWRLHRLRGEGWEAVVTPDIGGQVVQFMDSQGRSYLQILPLTAKNLSLFVFGGLADGPGRFQRDAFGAKFTVLEANATKLVLQWTDDQGLQITKTYRADGSKLSLITHLANTSQAPLGIEYICRIFPQVGEAASDDLVNVFTEEGTMAIDLFETEGSMLSYKGDRRPAGTWAASDPAQTHQLVHQIEEAEQVASYESWDSLTVYTMESLGKAMELAPGQEHEVRQSLSIRPKAWQP